jgi:hypothetical protein
MPCDAAGMPTNLALTIDIRGEVLNALKADPVLKGLIPRLYPARTPSKPDWPFGKMGAPITTPLYIDGRNGTLLSAAYHVYVRKTDAIADPEAYAANACSEIVRILNDMEGTDIGDGLTLDVFPRQAQVIQDEDADSFHGFVQWDADAS